MEFTYLVEYGMSPSQAIRQATSVAAEMMGWQNKTGSIEKDKFRGHSCRFRRPFQHITELQRVKFVIRAEK
jgi:imidazolonepropionase-like amidohydrolase